MIGRLTTLATSRPRRVLLAAGALFVVAAVLGLPVTGMLGSSPQDFEDPASQFERTNAEARAATGQNPEINMIAVLRSSRDFATDAAAEQAARTLAGLIASQHGAQRLLDYPATRSRALLSRDGQQTVLLAAACLILLALPFVTTYDDLLTAGAMRLGVVGSLQSVSPIEARMVVALLQLVDIHAAAAGSQLVVFPGLGHVPQEEDAQASVAPVSRFWA